MVALLAVPMLTTCTAGGGNPFASFESRCARLPAARFDVTAIPMQVDEVDSEDIAALTARSKTDPARHRTYGLTTVSFGHDTQSELRMLDYVALFVLIFVVLVIFYGIIAVHDIPYEIAQRRNHPHQDAIHAAGCHADTAGQGRRTPGGSQRRPAKPRPDARALAPWRPPA